jgi:ATP/ADP translocase
VLYPNRHNLHLEQFAPGSDTSLPYVRNLLRYWIFSTYYVVSELWGSVRGGCGHGCV